MILDNALDRYKVLIFLWGAITEKPVLERIDRWVRSGGTLIIAPGRRGHPATVSEGFNRPAGTAMNGAIMGAQVRRPYGTGADFSCLPHPRQAGIQWLTQRRKERQAEKTWRPWRLRGFFVISAVKNPQGRLDVTILHCGRLVVCDIMYTNRQSLRRCWHDGGAWWTLV
jgi:hypothetical protein